MTSGPTEEAVLDAFAVEPSHDDETTRRYLLAYPHYAEALIDLSRELSRQLPEDEPLSDREVAWIDEAVKRYAGSLSFVPPTVDQCRAAAKELRVPRQVVTAIIECKVVVDTISQGVRKVLAAHFESTLEGMIEAISGPPTSVSRSYKADGKPSVGEKAPFERVLRDAGVAEYIIADLLSRED